MLQRETIVSKKKSKSITSNNKNHNIHFIITSNNIIFNSNSSFLDKSKTNGPKLWNLNNYDVIWKKKKRKKIKINLNKATRTAFI